MEQTTPQEQATNALNVLMNALTNATNLCQSFQTVGAAENILRGFITAQTPDEPEANGIPNTPAELIDA